MTESKPPLSQLQLQPAGITFEQYVEFTPEKLELWEGYLKPPWISFLCPDKYGFIISNSPYKFKSMD